MYIQPTQNWWKYRQTLSSTKSRLALQQPTSNHCTGGSNCLMTSHNSPYLSIQGNAQRLVRILKVARTIADLEGSEDLAPKHLSEAVQ